MKFSIVSLFCSFALAAPAPSVLKDVSDKVFPILDSAVNQAILDAVSEVKSAIQKDTLDTVNMKIDGQKWIPKGIKNNLEKFIKNHLALIMDGIEKNIDKAFVPKMQTVLTLLQANVNKMDLAVDQDLAKLDDNIRKALHLPSNNPPSVPAAASVPASSA